MEKQAALARLFEMGEYYELSGKLDLAVTEKDEKITADTAEKMLSETERIRDFTASPLYEHMAFKAVDNKFVAEMKQNLINCFKNEDIFGFMKDNARWKKLGADH